MTNPIFPSKLTDLVAEYTTAPNSCRAIGCTSASTEKISHCAQCKIAAYCSRDCQRKDWIRHKHVCQIMMPRPTIPEICLKNVIKALPQNTIDHPFLSNGKVYLTTNELKHEQVVQQMISLPSQGNTLIGVSSLCNFNFAAARKNIEKIIILDISSRTNNFIENLAEIILSCTTKELCLKALTYHLDTYYTRHYVHDTEMPPAILQSFLLKEIEKMGRKESFLSSDTSYEKIRKLFQSGNIACKQVDLTDRVSCSSIKAIIDAEGLIVDTLYVSNIEEYISQNRMVPFYDFIKTVTHEGSYVIHTQPRPFKTTPYLSAVYQNLPLGKFIEVEAESTERSHICRPPLIQIIHKISQSLDLLFPALELASSDNPPSSEEFFFQLGLKQNFYTQELAIKAHLLALKIIRPPTTGDVSLEVIKKISQFTSLTLKGFD